MDLFLAYACQDEDYASGLADALAERGLEIGEPLPLWQGQRLLPLLDRRLRDTRAAVVVVSREFLTFWWARKDLDGLAARRRVYPVLSDVVEADVADHSPKLAVAALPGSLSDRLVRLIHPAEGTG